jgi:hypothetical protein
MQFTVVHHLINRDMLKSIGYQFRKPEGLLGKVISLIMTQGSRPLYDYIISELDIKRNERIFEIGYGTMIYVR